MEILSSASSSEEIWPERRRDPSGLCVAVWHLPIDFFLLYYAGYGTGGSGKPVCYLYYAWAFLWHMLI